jgi:hypothetical protein
VNSGAWRVERLPGPLPVHLDLLDGQQAVGVGVGAAINPPKAAPPSEPMLVFGFDSRVAQPVVAITSRITTPTHFTTAPGMDVLPTRRAAPGRLDARRAARPRGMLSRPMAARQPPIHGVIARLIG